jgi:hypothetical protein
MLVGVVVSEEGLGLRVDGPGEVGEKAGGKVSPLGGGKKPAPLSGPVGVSSARRVERSTVSRNEMVASSVVRQ